MPPFFKDGVCYLTSRGIARVKVTKLQAMVLPLRADFINVKITIFSEKSQNLGQIKKSRTKRNAPEKALRGVFAFRGKEAKAL
jgi:hypothetical protein